MSAPLLSILTPTVPARAPQLAALVAEVANQAAAHPGAVEHLFLGDHRTMTIGDKRNRLVAAATGDYIAFVDDDDMILDGYIDNILAAARAYRPSVVTFLQRVDHDGRTGTARFHAQNKCDEPFTTGTFARRPWHVCAWRRSLISECRFAHINFGEDAAWVAQAAPLISRGAHIEKTLLHYRHNPTTTLAPAPSSH